MLSQTDTRTQGREIKGWWTVVNGVHLVIRQKENTEIDVPKRMNSPTLLISEKLRILLVIWMNHN